MKLIKVRDPHRKPFTGEYECENCGWEERYHACYDSKDFQDYVVANWGCNICGKTTADIRERNGH
jgi:hypothetical protein